MLLVTACTTTQPAPTDTSVPPTQTPKQDVIELGELTFDGNECTVSGPSEVPTGKYSIVFNDTSEQPGIQVNLLGLLEDKTIQDLIDIQSEPGEWYPKPSWAFYGLSLNYPLDKEWVLVIDEEGEYVIYLWADSSEFLWFCKQITAH